MRVKPKSVVSLDSGLLASDRSREWLLSSYDENEWIVEDTAGEKERLTISFKVRMADGKMLSDHPALLSTAKELIFWMRAAPYTDMNARRQLDYANVMLRLCFGLTARGFKSFSNLNAIDVERICEDAARGYEGITCASKIIRDALAKFPTWSAVPSALVDKDGFNVSSVINELNLPERWSRKEIVSELNATAARLNGETDELEKFSGAADEAYAGDDQTEYEEQNEEEDERTYKVSVQQIHVVTSIFDALYSLRFLIEAPAIRFKPFPEGASLRASTLGSGTKPTPIAHPDLVFKLLEGAILAVAEGQDSVINEYDRAIQLSKQGSLDNQTAQLLRKQVDAHVTACYILIAAFTARRAKEIKKLYLDCLGGTEERGWWLKVYIAKSVRKRSWIPVPTVVARAVQAIAHFARLLPHSGDRPLFQYVDPLTFKAVTLRPETMINAFAASVGAHEHANDNGEARSWRWTTRQFRRFFAVLFFYKYKGKKETVAHHLRHFNMNTTDDYLALDVENVRIWQKEHSAFQVDVARDLVAGRNNYTGPMGEHLNKIVQRAMRAFSNKIEIVEEDMARYVVRAMKKQQLVLVPKLWVTCTCPRSAKGASKAACRKEAGVGTDEVGPDFASAGPSVCPGCPWALIANENLAYYDQEIERISANLAVVEEPTIFAELQAAKVVSMMAFKQSIGAGAKD